MNGESSERKEGDVMKCGTYRSPRNSKNIKTFFETACIYLDKFQEDSF